MAWIRKLQSLAHFLYGFTIFFLSYYYNNPDIMFIGTTLFAGYQFLDYVVTKDCMGEELADYFIGGGLGFFTYMMYKIIATLL